MSCHILSGCGKIHVLVRFAIIANKSGEHVMLRERLDTALKEGLKAKDK